MAKEKRQIVFVGSVQGVGFRYTACRAAAHHDVCGHVKNLPDGNVECVVEGEAEEIDSFVADLSQAMEGYIRDRREQVAPYSGKLGPFSVKY